MTQEQNLLTGQKPWLQLFIKRIQSQTLLIIVLFLLLQGFCYKDKRTEIQSSVLKKSSIKEALFKEFFFFVFVSKFVLVLTTLWHLLSISQYSLENVYKSCENVSFCFYTDQNNAPKKTYRRSIRSSGAGNRPPRKKKIANPRGLHRGAWLQVNLSHAFNHGMDNGLITWPGLAQFVGLASSAWGDFYPSITWAGPARSRHFYIELENSVHEQCERCPVSSLVHSLGCPTSMIYLENFQLGSRHHSTGIQANRAGSVVM